jgi:hypothetical protein
MEAQAQLEADAFPRGLGVPVEEKQGLPVDDLLDSGGSAVALDPGFEKLPGLVGLPLLLEEEAVVVIVFFRSRNELLKGLGAVAGEGELLIERGLHGVLSIDLKRYPFEKEFAVRVS